MEKHVVWAWAIKNSVVIVCWLLLAIHFGKWWIALFAALFTTSLRMGDESEKELEEAK